MRFRPVNKREKEEEARWLEEEGAGIASHEKLFDFTPDGKAVSVVNVEKKNRKGKGKRTGR